MRLRRVILKFIVALSFLPLQHRINAQMGTPTPLSPVERIKAEAEHAATDPVPNYPQLVDITKMTGIRFDHDSSPEGKFVAESMSGGVALIDYDGDGWPDIYFTNAQSVEMAQHGIKARSALFHNNHDGTFTDVTDKAGVGYPCWAMGAVVGDFNNDGRPDLLVTCLNGVVLYRNNGDGTFTDVTKASGLSADSGWATGGLSGRIARDSRPTFSCRTTSIFISITCPSFALRKNHVSIWGSMSNADRADSRACPTIFTGTTATEPSLTYRRKRA